MNSQLPEAFAGSCQDDDRDSYYHDSAPAYCGNGEPRDCDDNNADVYPGHGCESGKNTITISSDVDDSVVVDADDVVVISDGATINGNLEVNGGSLILSGSVTIKGNIESTGGTILIEEGVVIEGDVNIMVSGAGGVLEIYEGEIKGNVISNGIDTLTITDSNIDGNITSENDGDVIITGNTVNGNIEILGPQNCSESSNNVNGNNYGCP